MKIQKYCKTGLLAAALAAAGAVSASTTVRFSVDMSTQISSGAFLPGTDHVSARGTFNGWGELWLVQQGGGTVFTNSAVDSSDPNPGVLTYKFYNSHNGQWDDGCLNNSGKNRCYVLPATSGGSVTLPTVFFGDAGAQQTNTVRFNVDMAQAINVGIFDPATQSVYARGTFNGWGLSFPLTNDPSIVIPVGPVLTSNVYVGTFEVVGGSNYSPQFKYEIEPVGTWEADSTFYVTNEAGGGNNNRFFVLDSSGTQILSLVYFSDVPLSPVATNDVTFQVDMTAQVVAGRFDPSAGGNTVEVRGSFSGWASGTYLLTNNPVAANTNVYSSVIRIIDTAGAAEHYKFVMNNPASSYESSQPKLTTSDDGAANYNRIFNLTSTLGHPVSTVLPTVQFSDRQSNDYVLQDIQVIFKVNMSGAVDNTGYVFDPVNDTVWVNGEFANSGGQVGAWYPWQGGQNPVDAPAQYQLIENPLGSGIYSKTVTIPKGTPISFSYLYGLSIAASNNIVVAPYPDEPHAANRSRVIRSTASGSYALATDVWGQIVNEPLFSPYSLSGGHLTVGTPVGNTVPVQWLGRPGAHLQVKSSLSGGSWVDLPQTDGATWVTGSNSANGFQSQTNWPAGNQSFFRLVAP